LADWLIGEQPSLQDWHMLPNSSTKGAIIILRKLYTKRVTH
jgi:hypothetical protein